MRSLTLKLTLAFLLIGIVIVAMIGIFFSQQVRQSFDQFVLDRWQVDVIRRAQTYYEFNGGWDNFGTEPYIQFNDREEGGRPGGDKHNDAYLQPHYALLDLNGQVVYSEDPTITAGDTISGNRLDSAIPIEVNDSVVALVLFGETNTQPETITDSPETQFLDGVNRTVRFGMLGAVMLALLLGTLLARTISRPVQEMTAATERVAQGDLGHQVPVRTKDEIGKLAASFNKMSADLAQSTRLRRQMTADIAHDLRTPLSVILGYTEALSDGKIAADADILHVMYDKAKQLQRLVEDLRTLALADAGELSLIRRLVEPQMMLEHTALAHMVQAEAQNVSLHVEVDPDTPAIYVDRERMGQVLGNLVSNALRYTPNGGRITLGASSDGAQVTLRVADTGAGIAAEDLPHIFDRFYRVDKSRHNPSNESGLGLAIAKSIVQVHGGEITAVSDGPGYGTTFFIYLPITALIPNTTS